eukprot:scaffold6413_cov121-Isochrysis_galbana.AAC.3
MVMVRDARTPQRPLSSSHRPLRLPDFGSLGAAEGDLIGERRGGVLDLGKDLRKVLRADVLEVLLAWLVDGHRATGRDHGGGSGARRGGRALAVTRADGAVADLVGRLVAAALALLADVVVGGVREDVAALLVDVVVLVGGELALVEADGTRVLVLGHKPLDLGGRPLGGLPALPWARTVERGHHPLEPGDNLGATTHLLADGVLDLGLEYARVDEHDGLPLGGEVLCAHALRHPPAVACVVVLDGALGQIGQLHVRGAIVAAAGLLGIEGVAEELVDCTLGVAVLLLELVLKERHDAAHRDGIVVAVHEVVRVDAADELPAHDVVPDEAERVGRDVGEEAVVDVAHKVAQRVVGHLLVIDLALRLSDPIVGNPVDDVVQWEARAVVVDVAHQVEGESGDALLALGSTAQQLAQEVDEDTRALGVGLELGQVRPEA